MASDSHWSSPISEPVSIHATLTDYSVIISLLYLCGELVITVTSYEDGFYVEWQFVSADLSLVGLDIFDG